MTEKKTEVKKTKIDDDYFIDSDSYQFLLQKKSVVKSGEKKGEDTYSTLTYRGTITDILNDYTQIKLREGIKECRDIKEVKLLIKKLKNKIEEILGGW